MTAVFQHPGLRIVHADARALLARMPAGAVDHVICDPPYTDGVQRNVKSVWFVKGETRKTYADIDFESLDTMGYGWVPEALRVARRWVIAFCALEQLGLYQAAAGLVHPSCYVRSVVVRKKQATPQLTGDRPRQAAEGLAVMHRPGRKRWNGGGGGGWYETARAAQRTEDRWHPTQKNIDLMRAIVRDFTDPAEAILDPFAGSGTTGLAALLEHRRAILADNDPAWVAKMHERLTEDWGAIVAAEALAREASADGK